MNFCVNERVYNVILMFIDTCQGDTCVYLASGKGNEWAELLLGFLTASDSMSFKRYSHFEGVHISWRRNKNKAEPRKPSTRISVGKSANVTILRKQTGLSEGSFACDYGIGKDDRDLWIESFSGMETHWHLFLNTQKALGRRVSPRTGFRPW